MYTDYAECSESGSQSRPRSSTAIKNSADQ